MKIIHCSNHIQNSGNGIVNVAMDLACTQAQRGNHVTFVTSGGQFQQLLAEYGIRTYLIPQKSKNVFVLLSSFILFKNLCRSFKPDIVHTHMMSGAIMAAALRPFMRFKLVTHVHNEFQKSANVMRVGQRVIAVSSVVADHLAKRGFARSKLRVVLNGTIGSPRLAQMPEAWPLNRPAILTVAGMNERKGIADLIRAFVAVLKEVPDAYLYIAGDGPDRKKFEELAQTLCPPERVQFLGFVADPRALYLSADVFVLASHAEPFGLVISEAREAGLPIVASNVDGIPEACQYNAALLVPPKAPAELAEAIIKVLKTSELRDALASAAVENLARWSVDRVCDDVMAVYAEISR